MAWKVENKKLGRFVVFKKSNNAKKFFRGLIFLSLDDQIKMSEVENKNTYVYEEELK